MTSNPEIDPVDLIRPVAVEPRGGYRIWVRFADGAEGEADLSDLAGKGVFAAWEDRALFERVHISPWRSIAWNEEIELCPDALYLEITGKSAHEIMRGLAGEAVGA